MVKKGIRSGKEIELEKVKQEALEKAIKSGAISKDEYNRLLEQRNFDGFKKGSLTWNIFLAADQLKMQKDQVVSDVDVKVRNLLRAVATRNRYEKELVSKSIVSELKPGMPFSVDELEAEIFANNVHAKSVAGDIAPSLAKLRGFVGLEDLAGKKLITQEEFEDYANEINEIVKKAGFKVF